MSYMQYYFNTKTYTIQFFVRKQGIMLIKYNEAGDYDH